MFQRNDDHHTLFLLLPQQTLDHRVRLSREMIERVVQDVDIRRGTEHSRQGDPLQLTRSEAFVFVHHERQPVDILDLIFQTESVVDVPNLGIFYVGVIEGDVVLDCR